MERSVDRVNFAVSGAGWAKEERVTIERETDINRFMFIVKIVRIQLHERWTYVL